jgi:hypothetical protein
MARMIHEQRYVGHLRTCSFKRVIPFVQNDCVVQLSAIRNFLVDVPTKVPQTVRYIKHSIRETNDIDLHYNHRLYGDFSKESVLKYIEDGGARDLLVKNMSVLVSDDNIHKRCLKRFEESNVSTSDILVRQKYVAEYEGNPARRLSKEGKGAQWVQLVLDNMTEEEKQCGFEPSSLDLVSLLPYEIWRDIQGKTRISRAFKENIDKISEILSVFTEPDFSKEVVRSLVPQGSGLVGGRDEVLSPQKIWVVSNYH